MNRLLVALGAFLLLVGLPTTGSAQCGGMCSRLVKASGEAFYGCYYVEGSVYDCWATSTRCTLIRCSTALLTTPEGRVVGVREGCDKPETLPARVASALGLASSRISALIEQRARTAMVAARPAGAGPS